MLVCARIVEVLLRMMVIRSAVVVESTRIDGMLLITRLFRIKLEE